MALFKSRLVIAEEENQSVVPLDYSQKSLKLQNNADVSGVTDHYLARNVPSSGNNAVSDSPLRALYMSTTTQRRADTTTTTATVGRVQAVTTVGLHVSTSMYGGINITNVDPVNVNSTQPMAMSQQRSDLLSNVVAILGITDGADKGQCVPSDGCDKDNRGQHFSKALDGSNELLVKNECCSNDLSVKREWSPTQQYQNNHNDNLGIEIKPHHLVKRLAECPDCSSSLQNLWKYKNWSPSSVREVAISNSNIFCLKEKDVELKPEIRLCKEHCGPKGCPNRKSCRDLHICNKYIVDKCHNCTCVFGHKWNTGHNNSILKNLFMDNLSSRILKKLLKANSINVVAEGVIDVCCNYNGEGCNDSDCASLHICLAFIVGLGKECTCSLNHNFSTRSCLHLLERYGLPTNESPRDIALSLVDANPSLCERDTDASKDVKMANPPIGNKINHSLDNTNDYKVKGTKRRRKSETDSDDTKTVAIYTSPQTLWSHYLKGDIAIPEICYYSVESMCIYEGSGCQRLHSTSHFHWQVSEQDNQWVNLRLAQVKCLERAFCDPSKYSVTLPRLDPASLDNSLKDLFIMMGRDTWHSDFYSMTLTNSSASKKLYMRRLCTEKIEGVTLKPSTYVWYFLDQNNIWVQYGRADTLGNARLTSSLTSEQIEMLFLFDPYSDIFFQNAQFTYKISFQQMLQLNQTTGKFRQVTRRPEPHLQDEGMEDLPNTWKVMLAVRVQRVIVPDTSSEFQSVLNIINGSQSFAYSWIKIERIQNPYLWRAFENKVKELTVIYGNSIAVDERHLFHGTSYDIVKNICEENFDWRLHGSKHGNVFGCGTYFATSALYSSNYCKPDATGHCYMFIARVAVGSKVVGMSNMPRPPVNPATSLPFDSTVNDLQNPTIIVKYDKQEYYPKYVVMYRC